MERTTEHRNGKPIARDQLDVQIGPADDAGMRKVTASLNGKVFPGIIDPSNDGHRREFRERCYAKFGMANEDFHEALETLIIARVAAADAEPLVKCETVRL